MTKLHRAFAIQVFSFVVFVALIVAAGRSQFVTHRILEAQQRLGTMGLWGFALYPLLFAACNLLLLPGGILAVSSGLFFGLWWGFVLMLFGNVISAAVAFFLSRKLARKWVQEKVARNPKLRVLDKAIAREGWKVIFWSQLHPLFPTSLLMYFYGVTQISFSRCMIWATLARAPGLFLYAYLGTLAQFGIKLFRHQTHPAAHEYAVWIGGLVLTFVVTTVLGRIALRILGEAEREAAKNGNQSAEQIGA